MPRLRPLTSLAAVGLLALQLATWQATRAQTCNVRVEIETPADSSTVEARQVVTGWAVDLSATSGTGIDAVVASLDGALDSPDNRLVGVAEYGSPRPEIAETLGEERFTNSGFTLAWDTSTAPGGSHPLFLQAHSTCGWHTASRMVLIPGPAAPVAAVPTAAPVAVAASPTLVVASPVTPNTGSLVVAGGTATPISAVATPLTRTAVGTPTTGATTASSPAGALVVTPGALAPPPTSTTLQPPSNLRLTGTTSTGVSLTWDPPPGPPPTAYLIYQSAVTASGGNAPPLVVARVPGTSSTVTLSGLQDPTRYTYFFTVATGAADGSASPYLLTTVSTTPPNTRVAVPPTPPGGAPAAAAAAVPGVNLTPSVTPVGGTASASTSGAGGAFTTSVSAAGSTGVTVSWPAQVGATAYNVYGASMLAAATGQTPLAGAPPSSLAAAPPGTWVSVGSNVTGTSTSVSGLAPGGIYEFIVRTVNATGGEFSQSTPQQFSLPPASAAPMTSSVPSAATTPLPSTSALPPATNPSNFVLTITPASSTSLALSWNAFTGAATYGVLVSRPPGGQFVADSSRSALPSTSTVIDGLTAGSQFTFQIAAKDATGRELARSNQVPVTVGQPTAPGPLGTGPFPQATLISTPVLVPTPSLPSTMPGAPIPGVPGAVPGVSPGAGIPGAMPGAAPAAAVAGTGTLQLTSNVSDPGSANLQWNPLPGAASYSVWATGPTGQMQMVLPSTQNAAAYIPNLSAGQMTFQVRARDANGTEIAQSNPVTATISPR
jgi:hypothetical protein